MTAPRLGTAGALWTEDADPRAARMAIARHVDLGGGAIGLAAEGTAVAELRVPDAGGDSYLIRVAPLRVLVPDPAHPGDYVLGDPSASGARLHVADPAHPGDLMLAAPGAGSAAADYAEQTDGTQWLLRRSARTRLVLVVNGDYVVQ